MYVEAYFNDNSTNSSDDLPWKYQSTKNRMECNATYLFNEFYDPDADYNDMCYENPFDSDPDFIAAIYQCLYYDIQAHCDDIGGCSDDFWMMFI